MNAKRQTVWLVSMLSLMVVLSAYYLFTEDTNQLDVTTNGLEGREIKVDTSESLPPQGETGAKATDGMAGNAGRQPAAGSHNDQAGQADHETMAQAGDQKAAKTDAQVLQQMQNQATSGADFFENELMKRNEQFSKQTEQLMKVITDSQATTEAVSQASQEIHNIQDQQAKISNLEDALTKDFRHAIVTKEGEGKWKVIVQSNKLEKSQVVSIIDQALNQLNIGQDKISVQYVP